MKIMPHFNESEMLVLMEAARIGFRDADDFDEIADKLDIADEDLCDLRDRLQVAMGDDPYPWYDKDCEECGRGFRLPKDAEDKRCLCEECRQKAGPNPELEWEKKKEAYIKSSYCKCPYCESENIEGAMVEVDSGSAYQPISCNDCHKTWEDVYNFVNVEEKE